MYKTIFAFAVVFALAVTAHAEAPKYKVIVNARGPADSLKRTEAEALFLKKTTKVKDVTIVPFDQPVESAIRLRFSEGVLQRSPRAVYSYWQQRLFSGQGVPPKEVKDDASMIAAVASVQGGIGYVAVETALPDSVKILTITE